MVCRRLGTIALCSVAWLPERRAQVEAGGSVFMCQCELKDNNWAYYMNDILAHVQNLPQVLQDSQHPSTAWVMRQSCVEDASFFPNTDIVLDIGDLLRLRDVAALQGGGRLEAHHMCLPGQAAMAMVCTQQWLVKGSLMGIIKWVGKMTELLGIALECMDGHSPLPLRRVDFERYVAIFQNGLPKPDVPGFVSAFAFPFNARRKDYEEADEPMHECLPMKDPSCFPRNTLNVLESCSECCNPRKGPTGDLNCWVGDFTYDRCCHSSPRPGKKVEEPSRCQGQDELNRNLQKSLEQQVEASQEQGKAIASLREKLKICTEERDQERKARMEKETRIEALLAEANASQMEMEQLQHTKILLEEKVEGLAVSQGQMEEQTLKAKEARAERDALQATVSELKSELDVSTKAVASGTRRLEEHEGRLAELQRELKQARAEAQQLRTGSGSTTQLPPKKGGPVPCTDRNELCGEWAAVGMCQEMAEYMMDECPQACKAC